MESTLGFTLTWYLGLSAVLFVIGMLGVLVRRNAVVIFMSVELMLNAANLALIAIGQTIGDPAGQIMAFFVMAVAAGEVAVGLAILIALYRHRMTVNVDEVHVLRW